MPLKTVLILEHTTNNCLLEEQAGCQPLFYLFAQNHFILDYFSHHSGERGICAQLSLNRFFSLTSSEEFGGGGAKVFLSSLPTLEFSTHQ